MSFWYGARSRQELFYVDYFEGLARRFPNFRFELALSEPVPDDRWTGHVGFIPDVLERDYLAGHPQPAAVEYYLCGPPAMVEAARQMLARSDPGLEQPNRIAEAEPTRPTTWMKRANLLIMEPERPLGRVH